MMESPLNQTLSQNARTRVKICGLTSIDDAKAAVDAGADAIGLMFYKPSPRYVPLSMAEQIIAKVGPFVTTTAVLVDMPAEEIKELLKRLPVQLLQFHGNEPASFCEQFERPYIKAIRMKPDLDVIAEMQQYSSAQGVLLDAYQPGVPGGTGESFDWDRVPQSSDKPIILAGGLKPDNVETAVKQVLPYAVDVSGGVESSPGKKDANKIQQFIKNVHAL